MASWTTPGEVISWRGSGRMRWPHIEGGGEAVDDRVEAESVTFSLPCGRWLLVRTTIADIASWVGWASRAELEEGHVVQCWFPGAEHDGCGDLDE